MTSGKPSVAISMDVMSEYMIKNGITPGFAVRDNISEQQCGSRAQTRVFNKLDHGQVYTGEKVCIKAPVIELDVFPSEIVDELLYCELFFHVMQYNHGMYF